MQGVGTVQQDDRRHDCLNGRRGGEGAASAQPRRWLHPIIQQTSNPKNRPQSPLPRTAFWAARRVLLARSAFHRSRALRCESCPMRTTPVSATGRSPSRVCCANSGSRAAVLTFEGCPLSPTATLRVACEFAAQTRRGRATFGLLGRSFGFSSPGRFRPPAEAREPFGFLASLLRKLVARRLLGCAGESLPGHVFTESRRSGLWIFTRLEYGP